MRQALWASTAVAVATALAGCPSSRDEARYALQVRGGTYQDGSGRLGLAVLATMRDAAGEGPSGPWAGTLSDGGGPLAAPVYSGGGHAAWWWPEIAPRDGERYGLSLSDGQTQVAAGFAASPAATLPLPEPALAADASRIDWPAVAGAASYACRVFESGALVLETQGPAPGCALGSLPPGGYAASVLAFSADLAALAASRDRLPSLPQRFDVSEARLAFVRPEAGAPATTLLAAGGAFDFGTSTRGLALWLSIRGPGGTPTTSAWTVSVTGPPISPATPVTFTYHANFPRQMAWSYDIPAIPGVYALTAVSGATAVATTFAVGTPPWLPFVIDAVATARARGSAAVDWTPVAGARAYLVDVWDPLLGRSAASQWVLAPPAQFPDYTFIAGTAYQAYVAATDADMSGATVPLQVSVSEYPYLSAGFVAE